MTVSGPRYLLRNSTVLEFKLLSWIRKATLPFLIWQHLTAVHFHSSPEGYSTFLKLTCPTSVRLYEMELHKNGLKLFKKKQEKKKASVWNRLSISVTFWAPASSQLPSAQDSDVRIINNHNHLTLNCFPLSYPNYHPEVSLKNSVLEETVKQKISFLRPADFVWLVLNSYPMPWICNWGWVPESLVFTVWYVTIVQTVLPAPMS